MRGCLLMRSWLLPIALGIAAAGCGRSVNEVSVEERIYLTLRHEPPGWLRTGEESPLKVEVEGNVVLDPGGLLLFTAAEGDTGWTSQPFYPGGEGGVFLAVPAPARSGDALAYYISGRAPSGRRLTLPADLSTGGRPYVARWKGKTPAPLTVLMWMGNVLAAICLLGAGFTAWNGLQRRRDPGATDQAYLARWVGAGTVLLLISAVFLGAIHSWLAWGAPYRGFPFGASAIHSKVLLLGVIWGALSWSAWGSLTRRMGARDRLPPRLYAGMVLGALLITLLLLLLPDSSPSVLFPEVPGPGA